MKPTVISTFAGCGGSSLGYKLAGYRELLAVEWDDNAVQTFKLNFPEVPVFHGDIVKLSVDQCLNMAGLKPGELDVLDGSPPCQGFSTAGKRSLSDDRNQLFLEYSRLLKGLQPKIFVMENVSGMIKGHMKLIFAEIMKELKDSGYQVKAKLMNAMYYGVPQFRERVIFIGVRNGLVMIPGFPLPNKNIIMAKEAIPNLIATRSQRINPRIDSDKPCATICKIDSGYEAVFNTAADMEEAEIRESWQLYRILMGKEKKKHFGLVVLDPTRPAPTITKDAGRTTIGLIHPFEIRKLTIPEIKRLASFPDYFKFIGSYREKWARIGNSVPPLMMKAIAEHIKKILEVVA